MEEQYVQLEGMIVSIILLQKFIHQLRIVGFHFAKKLWYL